MVVNVGPILIALLSGWLLKEGFPPRLLAGMAVSFAGAVVVGLSLSGGGASPLLGVALCLVAAVTYAVAVVLQKPALKHASPLQVTTFGCLVGTAAAGRGQLVTQAGAAPVTATLQIVYLGVFPTALAFSTWAYALSRTTAGRWAPRRTRCRCWQSPCRGPSWRGPRLAHPPRRPALPRGRRGLPHARGPARREGNGDPRSRDGRWRAARLGRHMKMHLGDLVSAVSRVCDCRTAQRSSWMRTRLPAGSRKAQSRIPYGCSVGSWTTSASPACTLSKVPLRSAVASRIQP